MATNITVAREYKAHGLAYADLYGASGLGASDDGAWMGVDDLESMSVEFDGINGDTCALYGSNLETKPADSADHAQIGSNITADAIVYIEAPIRWVKAKFTKSSGTAVHAYFSGIVRGM